MEVTNSESDFTPDKYSEVIKKISNKFRDHCYITNRIIYSDPVNTFNFITLNLILNNGSATYELYGMQDSIDVRKTFSDDNDTTYTFDKTGAYELPRRNQNDENNPTKIAEPRELIPDETEELLKALSDGVPDDEEIQDNFNLDKEFSGDIVFWAKDNSTLPFELPFPEAKNT